MSEQQASIKSSAIKYGLILGTISFIYGLVIQYAGMTQGPLAYVGIIFSIVFLVLGMKEFRTQNDGFMSFGQGLKLGVLLSFISSLLSGAVTALYFGFIDDSPLQNQLAKSREQLESNPQMTEEAIDMAMGVTETMMQPQWMFLMAVFLGTLFGLILSLIIAAIMKKNAPEY